MPELYIHRFSIRTSSNRRNVTLINGANQEGVGKSFSLGEGDFNALRGRKLNAFFKINNTQNAPPWGGGFWRGGGDAFNPWRRTENITENAFCLPPSLRKYQNWREGGVPLPHRASPPQGRGFNPSSQTQLEQYGRRTLRIHTLLNSASA